MEKNKAFALSFDFQEPSLAVLPLMIITSKSSNIIPEYLAWLMNSPRFQTYFDAEAQETSMRMISKSTLDDLSVVVPEVTVQQKIVKVTGLDSREKALLSDLADTRAGLVTESIISVVDGFGGTTEKRLSQ